MMNMPVRSRLDRPNRQGVVLLVILGLLAALALLGVSFLILAGSEEKASRNFRLANQKPTVDIEPRVLFAEALGQLIADTTNPHSAIRGHSLLADMYGNDSDVDPTTGLPPGNGHTEVTELYQRAFNGPGETGPDGRPGTPNPMDDADVNYVYNARIPMMRQPQAGQPYQLIGGFDEDYDYPDHNNMFLASMNADGTVRVPSFHRPGYLTDQYSAGFTPKGDWGELGFATPARGARLILRPRGGYSPGPDGVINTPAGAATPSGDDIPLEHPRFFDPTLINPGTGQVLDPIDETTGRFRNDANGRPRYDVDNLGNGIRDSIWVDLGFPVQKTDDGRRFKPLFAFLIVDLDNRVNLNVHGNLLADKLNGGTFANLQRPEQADGVPDSHADLNWVDVQGRTPPLSFPTPTQGALYAAGQGASVTEVCLQNIFMVPDPPSVNGPDGGYRRLHPNVDPREYAWLLAGRPGPSTNLVDNVPGRYGEEAFVLDANSDGVPDFPAPGAGLSLTVGLPNIGDLDDDLPRNRWVLPYITPGGGPPYRDRGDFGETDDQRLYNASGALVANAAGRAWHWTPSDLNGSGLRLLNNRGQFQFLPMLERYLSGYRIGVDPATDAPHILPMTLGPNLTGWYNWQSQLYDPINNQPLPGAIQDPLENINEPDEINVYRSTARDLPFTTQELETLYRLHELSGGSLQFPRLLQLAPSLGSILPQAFRQRHMVTTESWDLINYGIFPNAPDEAEGEGAGDGFGAGYIGTGNGRLKPTKLGPLNLTLPEEILKGRRLSLTPILPEDEPNTNLSSARQYFARELYALLTQVTNGIDPDRLAQYCVNVVDFVDPDDTMTRFVPDTSNPNRVYYGMEAPQVCLNEALATHDGADTALWVELYNPQDINSRSAVRPGQFNPNQHELNLQGRSPARQGWRVVLDYVDPATAGQLINPKAFQGSTPAWPPQADPSDTAYTLVFDGSQLFGGGNSDTVVDADPVDESYLVLRPNGVDPPGGMQGSPRIYDVDIAQTNTTQVDGGGANQPFKVPPNDSMMNPVNQPNHIFRIYLQRLADTNRDFHQTFNPYITVDAIDIQMQDTSGGGAGVSYERIHPYNSQYAGSGSGAHTLGTINSLTQAETTRASLIFNDRPLISPTELLFVPAISPQHFTDVYWRGKPGAPIAPGQYNPYNPQAALRRDISQVNESLRAGGQPSWPTNGKPYIDSPDFMYGHLFNFFREQAGVSPATPGLYRIFEFVEVPSRMSGSKDPTIDPTFNIANTPPKPDPRKSRVTGKLNINTLTEIEILQALFNNHPSFIISPDMIRVFDFARRGGQDGLYYTADDRPFRSFAHAPWQNPPQDPAYPVPGIDSTIFRRTPAFPATPHPDLPAADQTNWTALTTNRPNTPMFEDIVTQFPEGLIQELLAGNGLQGYPHEQWKILQKMHNSFTTRSNVYAVWLTVGFFEVVNEDPNRLLAFGIRNAPPELGPEFNLDIGKHTRHRFFAIIDRSRARGYTGPPRSSEELQNILRNVVVHEHVIE